MTQSCLPHNPHTTQNYWAKQKRHLHWVSIKPTEQTSTKALPFPPAQKSIHHEDFHLYTGPVTHLTYIHDLLA